MTDLSTISKIWTAIVMSNTFNFVIFVLILAWVAKKINVGAIISALQQKIIKLLDETKKNHEEAKNELLNAEKSVANLDTELKVIVEDAQNSADVISKKILSEAEKQLANIDANVQKVINAEEKLIISSLTKNTSKASIDNAKAHIQNALTQAPNLHEKYINESINELDRLNF